MYSDRKNTVANLLVAALLGIGSLPLFAAAAEPTENYNPKELQVDKINSPRGAGSGQVVGNGGDTATHELRRTGSATPTSTATGAATQSAPGPGQPSNWSWGESSGGSKAVEPSSIREGGMNDMAHKHTATPRRPGVGARRQRKP